MAVLAAKRAAQSLGVLLLVLTLVFLVGRLIGDPAYVILGPERMPEDYERLRESLGLNDALVVQYSDFITGAAVGDFGDSFWQKIPAFGLALERLPATLYLAFTTLILAVPLAIFVGSIAAWRPRSAFDRIVNVASLGGASVVDFWLGLMLILVFAVQFGVLPTSGFDGPEYVVLPAMTLALRPFGRIAQITRSAMLDELAKPYVALARAKGLRESRVVFNDCLRNALIPIVTLGADEFLGLMNGAVVVETIFAWPGVGQLLIQAIERRDLPLVESAVFIIAAVVVITNVLVDLAYLRMNPSIRLPGARTGG